VQKFVSETKHIYNVQSVLVSKRLWDQLSAEERKILQDSAQEARDFQRKATRQAQAAALDELRKGGMIANTISDAEMARIREAAKPVVAKFSNEVGPELVKEINDALASGRK
jgi:TRAP-type transport system periplasmic protein